MTFAAQDIGWPEASIAIAGIAFITIVASVLIWQIFATGSNGALGEARERLSEACRESGEAQNRTAAGLENAAAELADLRQRTGEVERMLKDVG
jgi:hypothetical protein